MRGRGMAALLLLFKRAGIPDTAAAAAGIASCAVTVAGVIAEVALSAGLA